MAVIFSIVTLGFAWRRRTALARAAGTGGTWLVPTAVAAAGGALATGACEAAAMKTPVGISATIGFASLVALPALLAISAATRLLWLGWRPRELALVDGDGSAPRLVAWAAVVALGLAALGGIMFEATSLLSYFTEFKPTTLAFAEPGIAIAAAALLLAMSRPVARSFTAIARALDRRWRTRGSPARRSLFTVRNIAVATATVVVAIGYSLWRFAISPQIGAVDTALFWPPAIGLAALATIHGTWPRWRWLRRVAGAILPSILALSIGHAMFTWRERPSLTLGVWGECALSGIAIDVVFDLDEIRSRVPAIEFRPTPRADAAHPDIVLVTIDTVRADHTPPYGGAADMPALRELAARGVVFDWAFSPSNVTRRSIPSMIIGFAPDRIRGRVVGWALRVDPRYVLVAERLAAGGYDTAGFMCCERFWGRSMRTGLERGLSHLEIEANGLALARRAKKWLAERDAAAPRAPLFVWMHILEPHHWTAGGDPAIAAERTKQYDRSLTAADAALGELLSAFANRGPDRAPMIIVTADHGESLGDHGQPYHSTDLYNSQIRVPFVIAGPGIRPGRIAQTVSLTDLTPTLLELAGFEPFAGPALDRLPNSLSGSGVTPGNPWRGTQPGDLWKSLTRGNAGNFDGQSVADLATGQRAADADGGTAFAAMIRDRSNPGGVTALIRGRWKLIESAAGFELYDLRSDPTERNNAIATHPREFDQLRRALVQRRQAAARSPFE